jgi:S1-C subfamily serine protease
MDIKKIIEKNRAAVVLLDIQKSIEGNQKNVSIRGTGFIIKEDGTFVTNAHVYTQVPKEDLPHLGVSVPGKTDDRGVTFYNRYPVKLLKLDEENDLALMQVTDGMKFSAVSKIDFNHTLVEGEEIVFTGYPLATEMLGMGFGITMTANKCIVSSVKRRGDGSLHFFFVDTHTNNGSSGSPVFSLETGDVIGVVSGKISSKVPGPNNQVFDIPANIGICRPAKYIENLLK